MVQKSAWIDNDTQYSILSFSETHMDKLGLMVEIGSISIGRSFLTKSKQKYF